MVWKTNFQAALTVAAREVNLIGGWARLQQREGSFLRPLGVGLHPCWVPPEPTTFGSKPLSARQQLEIASQKY